MHWIWYGFPTPTFEQGSATNKAFALKPEEFQAYLQTPALLQNLLVTLACVSYAIKKNSGGAQNVLGDIDYQKAQNSITALSACCCFFIRTRKQSILWLLFAIT